MKWRITLFALFIFVCSNGVAKDRDYVREAFSRGDFVPYVYDDAEIVKKYGKGFVETHNETASRVYFDAKSSLWVKVFGDANIISKYRMIEEIIVTPLPLAKTSYAYTGSLDGLQSRGVKIGDSKAQALKAAKKGFNWAIKNSVLGGQKVEEIYFHPSEEDTSLFYKFFIRDEKVVGLAMGVTE